MVDGYYIQDRIVEDCGQTLGLVITKLDETKLIMLREKCYDREFGIVTGVTDIRQTPWSREVRSARA